MLTDHSSRFSSNIRAGSGALTGAKSVPGISTKLRQQVSSPQPGRVINPGEEILLRKMYVTCKQETAREVRWQTDSSFRDIHSLVDLDSAQSVPLKARPSVKNLTRARWLSPQPGMPGKRWTTSRPSGKIVWLKSTQSGSAKASGQYGEEEWSIARQSAVDGKSSTVSNACGAKVVAVSRQRYCTACLAG